MRSSRWACWSGRYSIGLERPMLSVPKSFCAHIANSRTVTLTRHMRVGVPCAGLGVQARAQHAGPGTASLCKRAARDHNDKCSKTASRSDMEGAAGAGAGRCQSGRSGGAAAKPPSAPPAAAKSQGGWCRKGWQPSKSVS
jgi:hypothetical protein